MGYGRNESVEFSVCIVKISNSSPRKKFMYSNLTVTPSVNKTESLKCNKIKMQAIKENILPEKTRMLNHLTVPYFK